MRHKGIVIASGVSLLMGFTTVAIALYATKVIEEFMEDTDFNIDGEI